MAKTNIVITGFMGTGKSSVGRLLADRLHWEFVDTDQIIERRLSMSVVEIFQTHGEARFRAEERRVLADIGNARGLVVATGGGTLLSSENRALVEGNSLVICLTCAPDELLRRLAGDLSRPLIAGADREKRILDLLAKRGPSYDAILNTIDTTNLNVEDVVDLIASTLEAAPNQ